MKQRIMWFVIISNLIFSLIIAVNEANRKMFRVILRKGRRFMKYILILLTALTLSGCLINTDKSESNRTGACKDGICVQDTNNIYKSDAAVVPEPVTIALFGSGMIGLWYKKRRQDGKTNSNV